MNSASPIACFKNAGNSPDEGRRPSPHCRVAIRDFDLAATLNSGQVFHWINQDGGFVGLVDRTPVFVAQPRPDELVVSGAQGTLVSQYFGLDHDLDAIRRTFPLQDAVLERAVAFCPGLRIIRQPLWECLATFLTSSLKQLAHIRQISFKLRECFGEPILFGNSTLYTYPKPEVLAEANERELLACGLGYRAKFLAATARAVASGDLVLDELRGPEVSDAEAIARLCRAPGVGPKIASCVLLFGAERLGSFPIDVWVERVLRQLYQKQTAQLNRAQLAKFTERHFGPCRGYAQQFLFHHARLTMPRRRNKA
ncbi:MAG: DNA-3-methyladenine glycosylase family protein [Verrucomicrobiales bacterium]